MEITLEAVEKVMAEAEVEFAEAKAALIGADGNAEAAIEAIKASRAAVEEAADEVQDLGAKGDTFEDVFNRTVEKATAGAEKAAEQTKAKTDEIVAKVKKAVQDGNVDRIVVKRNDEVLLNIPVNVGIVGGLIGLTAAPFAMIAAAAAAYGFSCKFEIVKKDGSVREAFGTLNSALCNKHINGRGQSPETWGCSCYFDCEKGQFRSFRWQNIIDVLS